MSLRILPPVSCPLPASPHREDNNRFAGPGGLWSSASVSTSRETLSAVMAEHGIELPADRIALLDRYCALVWDWNTRLNLTRHTNYQKFVTRDLVDSLAFSRFLAPGERVLDVGTGGGVPGVVLAVLRPDLSIALCESVGKRRGQ